jgi:hypothetical protein
MLKAEMKMNKTEKNMKTGGRRRRKRTRRAKKRVGSTINQAKRIRWRGIGLGLGLKKGIGKKRESLRRQILLSHWPNTEEIDDVNRYRTSRRNLTILVIRKARLSVGGFVIDLTRGSMILRNKTIAKGKNVNGRKRRRAKMYVGRAKHQ